MKKGGKLKYGGKVKVDMCEKNSFGAYCFFCLLWILVLIWGVAVQYVCWCIILHISSLNHFSVTKVDVQRDLQISTANPNAITRTQNRIVSLISDRTTVIIDFPISSGIWRCDLKFHNAGAGLRLSTPLLFPVFWH